MEQLRQFRKRAGLTIEQVAERLGLSGAQISRLERGDSVVSLTRLRQFATLYGCTVSELVSDTATLGALQSLVTIEVVGEVQAGVWREALEWPPSDRYMVQIPVNPRFGRVPLFALVVKGNSMNRLYPHDSMVICAKYFDLGRDPAPGERVVTLRRSDSEDGFEATIKELQKHPDGSYWLWPRSDDPAFQQPWRLKDNGEGEDVRIEALVVGSMKYEV